MDHITANPVASGVRALCSKIPTVTVMAPMLVLASASVTNAVSAMAIPKRHARGRAAGRMAAKESAKANLTAKSRGAGVATLTPIKHHSSPHNESILAFLSHFAFNSLPHCLSLSPTENV